VRRTVQVVPSHHAALDPGRTSAPSEPTLPNTSSIKGTANPSLRDEIYTSASHEKTARAAEFSSIKRALSKDNIVIADSLNYIKGYRYQLWCEAKAAGTRCSVVHVAAREEECRKWNEDRLVAWGRQIEVDKPDEEETRRTQTQSAAQGENVMGELMPESHTAIYGDRVVQASIRSRSSSMEGSDGGGEDVTRRPLPDDTMTLKSLYISPQPKAEPEAASDASGPGLHSSQPDSSSRSSFPKPTDQIPQPSSSHPYAPSTLTALAMRYEPPSPFSRWDTPLFTIPSADEVPPVQEIWNAIYPPPVKALSKKARSQLPARSRLGHDHDRTNGNVPRANTATADSTHRGCTAPEDMVKPHAATVLPRATASDALQLLESATLDVIKALLAAHRIQALSSSTTELSFSVPLGGEGPPLSISLPIPSSVTLSQPMLQRLRRKYTQIQRGGIAHGVGHVRGGRQGIVQGFVEYLEAEFEADED
jgi:tRNA uridine 5-carbamoylmethylation protein Kti12